MCARASSPFNVRVRGYARNDALKNASHSAHSRLQEAARARAGGRNTGVGMRELESQGPRGDGWGNRGAPEGRPCQAIPAPRQLAVSQSVRLRVGQCRQCRANEWAGGWHDCAWRAATICSARGLLCLTQRALAHSHPCAQCVELRDFFLLAPLLLPALLELYLKR